MQCSWSTVETYSASVHVAFWKILTRSIRAGGLGPDPRDGPDDLRTGIVASCLRHFSLSVQLDVRARVAGTPGDLTLRCSATVMRCMPV